MFAKVEEAPDTPCGAPFRFSEKVLDSAARESEATGPADS